MLRATQASPRLRGNAVRKRLDPFGHRQLYEAREYTALDWSSGIAEDLAETILYTDIAVKVLRGHAKRDAVESAHA